MSKGLLEYEQYGEITPAFLKDFSNLCLKIYKRWTLKCTLEDFQGFCTEKLIGRLSGFEPEKGNIGNFIFNLILNEARRIHSREEHDIASEFEEVALYIPAPTDTLLDKVWSFALLAYNSGVYISQEMLLMNYTEGKMTPVNKTFTWLMMRGEV